MTLPTLSNQTGTHAHAGSDSDRIRRSQGEEAKT